MFWEENGWKKEPRCERESDLRSGLVAWSEFPGLRSVRTLRVVDRGFGDSILRMSVAGLKKLKASGGLDL